MSENGQRIRVLCVEDEAVIALDLQHSINKSPDMLCVGWLSKADALAEEIQAKSPDVVLLDLSMPGRDPLEVLAEVTAANPALKVIVCSGYGDSALIERAYKAGAKSYVKKGAIPEDLLESIRKAAACQL